MADEERRVHYKVDYKVKRKKVQNVIWGNTIDKVKSYRTIDW
ncbi:MAG TPA: hypothetical protein VG098_06310 [Nitrososphaera sp.]|nr:hypothetical protein [Nitrososphaera sp.]